jgi:hypothetical protein
MDILTQLLTGKDNTTHDLFRWLAVGSVVTGLALEIYSVVSLKKTFDMQAFGLGMAAVFAGAGAGLKLKEGTEP